MATPKSALPSHVKADGAPQANGEAGAFKRNHHGKSQSHVVSILPLDIMQYSIPEPPSIPASQDAQARPTTCVPFWEGTSSSTFLQADSLNYRRPRNPPSCTTVIVPLRMESGIPHYSERFFCASTPQCLLGSSKSVSSCVVPAVFYLLPLPHPHFPG